MNASLRSQAMTGKFLPPGQTTISRAVGIALTSRVLYGAPIMSEFDQMAFLYMLNRVPKEQVPAVIESIGGAERVIQRFFDHYEVCGNQVRVRVRVRTCVGVRGGSP